MSYEFLVVQCRAPWGVGHLDAEQIKAIGEARINSRKWTSDELDLHDPYSLTRDIDDDEDEHPPILEAVQEWFAEALHDMFGIYYDEWALQENNDLWPVWISGGMSAGDDPTTAYGLIKAFDQVGLWNEPVTQDEIDAARKTIAERKERRMKRV